MSLDLNVYCKRLSDDVIPHIVKRLNDFEMNVEIDPNFSFRSPTSFLSFKYEFTNPYYDILKGKTLTSGFEVFVSDLSKEKEKEQFKQNMSFLDKLFRVH